MTKYFNPTICLFSLLLAFFNSQCADHRLLSTRNLAITSLVGIASATGWLFLNNFKKTKLQDNAMISALPDESHVIDKLTLADIVTRPPHWKGDPFLIARFQRINPYNLHPDGELKKIVLFLLRKEEHDHRQKTKQISAALESVRIPLELIPLIDSYLPQKVHHDLEIIEEGRSPRLFLDKPYPRRNIYLKREDTFADIEKRLQLPGSAFTLILSENECCQARRPDDYRGQDSDYRPVYNIKDLESISENLNTDKEFSFKILRKQYDENGLNTVDAWLESGW